MADNTQENWLADKQIQSKQRGSKRVVLVENNTLSFYRKGVCIFDNEESAALVQVEHPVGDK